MSIITGIGKREVPKPARRAPEQGAFAVPFQEASPSDRTVSYAATVSAASLNLILGAQEQSGAAVQDREARRRGQELLRALSRVQQAMLAGGDADEPLGDLARLAADLPPAAYRGLRAALQAVALRARVELARRGH